MKQYTHRLTKLLAILFASMLFPYMGSGQTNQEVIFMPPCDSFGISTLPSRTARIMNEITKLDSTINASIVRRPEDKEATAYYHYNFYVDCQGRFVASMLETYDGTMGMANRIMKLLNTNIKWSSALQNETPVNSMVKINVQVRKGKISVQP